MSPRSNVQGQGQGNRAAYPSIFGFWTWDFGLSRATCGQDGAHHRNRGAGWLLPIRVSAIQGYEVQGIELPGRAVSPQLCTHLHYVDLGVGSNLAEVLDAVRPDEVYNLAGLSRVSASFDDVLTFASVNGLGTARILEAIRGFRDRTGREIRFYQASSSEMFGSTDRSPQNESTRFHPRSPYACAKLYAHLQTINHREAFPACSRAAAFCSTTSRRGGTSILSRGRSRGGPRGFKRDCKTGCASAISTRVAIGALPEITSRRCGSCCSRIVPTTM